MRENPGLWTGVVVVWFSVAAGAPGKNAQRTAEAQEWPLPVEAGSLLLRLRPTVDGRLVFLDEVREVEKGDQIVSRTLHHLLDTSTGRWSDVGGLFSKAAAAGKQRRLSCHPAPNGRHVLFVVEGDAKPPRQAAWLFTLAEGKARKLAEAREVMPAWAGQMLYLGRVDAAAEGDTVGPVEAFDVSRGTSSRLKICGAVVGGDPRGTFLVCICDPGAATKPLSMTAFRREGAVAVLTPTGKVLQRLGRISQIPTPPVVSPRGKVLAVRRRAAAAERGKGRLYVIDVVTVGAGKRTLPDESRPIAVTDAGEVVVTRRTGFYAHRYGVLIWEPSGEPRVLVRDTALAGVGGDALFYVSGRDKLVLKRVPLRAER